MKTFNRITVSLLLLGAWAGFPALCPGSETRIDATGGLATLLTDETTDLSLFLDGNPAGLPLLNSRSRLDLSGQWWEADRDGPWGTGRQQALASLPRFADPNIRFEGLMAFPSPQWAFQVSGDLASQQGLPVPGSLSQTQRLSDYRGLLRAAYALPFGSFGLEILETQTDRQWDTGVYDSSLTLLSGASSQSQCLVRAGIAATFPSPVPPEEARWQAGAFFTFPAATGPEEQNLNFLDGIGNPYPVTRIYTLTHFNFSQAEILYEVPASLKIRFSASLQNTSTDFEQRVQTASVYFSPQPRFHDADLQTLSFEGAFRYRAPFQGEENLKLGGSLGFQADNDNRFTAAGSPALSLSRQRLLCLFGLGLEEEKEYTFGLQWKSRFFLPGSQLAPVDPGPLSPDYDFYQLTFGGEKWLAATWAFRLGLTLEEDMDAPSALNTLTTTINLGLGLEKVFGRIDLRTFLGQTLDIHNSGNTIGLLGAQASGTLFL